MVSRIARRILLFATAHILLVYKCLSPKQYDGSMKLKLVCRKFR
jgi:hypothetical protein